MLSLNKIDMKLMIYIMHKGEMKVKINIQILIKKGSFKHLWFIIQEDKEIYNDIADRIRTGWM